ncbi:hypothetical protein ACJX0J_007060 [Zea mays]
MHFFTSVPTALVIFAGLFFESNFFSLCQTNRFLLHHNEITRNYFLNHKIGYCDGLIQSVFELHDGSGIIVTPEVTFHDSKAEILYGFTPASESLHAFWVIKININTFTFYNQFSTFLFQSKGWQSLCNISLIYSHLRVFRFK